LVVTVEGAYEVVETLEAVRINCEDLVTSGII
jgi:hypothetical protein